MPKKIPVAAVKKTASKKIAAKKGVAKKAVKKKPGPAAKPAQALPISRAALSAAEHQTSRLALRYVLSNGNSTKGFLNSLTPAERRDVKAFLDVGSSMVTPEAAAKKPGGKAKVVAPAQAAGRKKPGPKPKAKVGK